MGPTSGGKTTIAQALMSRIRADTAMAVTCWDGDQVREMLGSTLGFSSDDRLRVVRTLAKLAKLTSDEGVFTIVSALTAHENARQMARSILPNHFVGYIHCPIDTCIARDPKGLYKRAINGEIDTLIGFNDAYVAPEQPDIEIDTSQMSLSESIDSIALFLFQRNFGCISRNNNKSHGHV